jgi:hypothetical protein
MSSFFCTDYWKSIVDYVKDTFVAVKTSNFMGNIYFNLIFSYTQCQILAKKSYNHVITNYPSVKTFFDKINEHIPKEAKPVLEFIKDGEVLHSFTDDQLNKGKLKFPGRTSYDFFLFSDYLNSRGSSVQKVIHTNPDKNTWSSSPSPIKFILCEITIGSNLPISVSFCNNKYNYLMRNNVIDSDFLRYFMKKHYQMELYDHKKQEIKQYTLKIMDDNVIITTLAHNERILLIDDEYKIVPTILYNK